MVTAQEFEDENMKKAEVVEIKKKEFEYLNLDKMNEAKKEFLEGYFEKQFVDYGNSPKWGKSFDFIYQPTNEISRRMIKTAWNRVKAPFEEDYEEFNAVVMLSVFEAVRRFKGERGQVFDWLKINEADTFESNNLHGYIATAIYKDTRKIANQLQNIERRQGGKKDVYVYLGSSKVQSIDEVVVDGEGQEIFVHELLGSDSNYFNNARSNFYEKSHFIQFFYDNFETKMLTNAQREFLKVFPQYYIGDRRVGYNDLEPYAHQNEENRPYNEDKIKYMFRAIRLRVTQAYNEAFPDGGLTRSQLKLRREEATLKHLVELVEEGTDEDLSEFILKSLKDIQQELPTEFDHNGIEKGSYVLEIDNTAISDLLYEMKGIHSMNVNEANRMKTTIRKETLYEFVNQAYKRLDQIERLQRTGVQAQKFYKKDEEFLFESREELLKRKAEREKFDAEKSSEMNYRITTLMPSGMIEEINSVFDDEFQEFILDTIGK